ncbi:MFS transporter AGZA family, xanthine uracil permease [Fusarium agapanthi]|uniref:MFS transporter AGZA family, xanthine uracil permease n=1 Tax=Fusarium agapanthi TaxID=1803897 RepID=A0A9P5BBG6_9HYPO|nr:MFS transporter AGZA family, xanthine uracil permease [Fusarium agapanthi]
MKNHAADLAARLNRRVATSFIGRLFRLEGSSHSKEIDGTTFLKEVRAGATTFAAMMYIIAVNGTDEITEVRRDLVTATSAIAGLASLVFGLFTNLPIALAPGMGLNAYFAFQVVGYNGSGSIPYGVALTAVFTEGLIFVFLALTGMRQWLVKLIPSTIKSATGAGIGLFLTEIGLSYGSGIGAITGGFNATPLAIAGCPVDRINPDTQMCEGGIMTSPKLWTAIFAGGLLTAYLMAFRVKYAFVIGIAFVSILSWPRETAVTYFPHTPEGDSRFELFRKVASINPMKHTLNALDWNVGQHGTQFALALFTFLYVDIIDATATMFSMVRFCGVVDDRDGDFPRSTLAYCCDAISISVSALFGCSPVTAFIESGAGIAEGGRTGLTAMTTGFLFLLSIVFGPIFSSVPPWATGPALILVGCMMARQITEINWRYIGDTLPSFFVIAFVPFSYSVAYGIIAGMFLYTALNLMISLTVRISGGRLEPDNYDMKEYWTWKAPGRKPCTHESSPQTFDAHGGLDCEMVRVASSDGRKDDTHVSISVPLPALSRFSR